jgi:DhnA family fructose-bisphosphate aldolase class Ia
MAMRSGKSIRMNRIFARARSSTLLALDHQVSYGHIDALHNMAKLLTSEVLARVDGIVAHCGRFSEISSCLSASGADVALLAQTFVGSVHTRDTKGHRKGPTVLHCIAHGADAVCVQLYLGHPNMVEQMSDAAVVANDAQLYGIPCLAMVYPSEHYGSVDTDAEYTRFLCDAVALCMELGVDILKIPFVPIGGWTESFSDYSIPVVVAGGPKQEADVFIQCMRRSLENGAAGVCVGRNLFESDNPAHILSLLTRC